MKILLLYKNSTYASYFLSDRKRFAQLQGLFNSQELRRFRKTHENHFWALSYIEAVLKHRKLKFTKVRRGSPVDYGRYKLVITVGGDGTFMEAARHLSKQLIWGINSDPSWSVGRFCGGHGRNFEPMLEKILQGKVRPRVFNRLILRFKNGVQTNVVNDVLVCHRNPAALSRYYLTVGRRKEEQRSSGVWVSTAAGSSAGIHSAGGRILPPESKNIQYRPRELYRGHGITYRLSGGILKPQQKVCMTSLMREGVVYVDGSHLCFPFSFGAGIEVAASPLPLKVII